MPPSDAQIRVLLDLLDEACDKKSWHGPNPRGSIRGVTAARGAAAHDLYHAGQIRLLRRLETRST